MIRPARNLLLLVVLALAACGASARQKTIQGALVGVNAARDGFITWDSQHQLSIVEKATSREEAELALKDYRTRREVVKEAFEVAYRALAVAATQTDELSLHAALAASDKLVDAVKKLTGGS